MLSLGKEEKPLRWGGPCFNDKRQRGLGIAVSEDGSLPIEPISPAISKDLAL